MMHSAAQIRHDLTAYYVNSLVAERCGDNFKHVSTSGNFGIPYGILLRWMALDVNDDASVAIYYYQGVYGVGRDQWVNSLRPSDAYMRR